MNRIALAFQWFFSILFGGGAARLAQLEQAELQVAELQKASQRSTAAGARQAPAAPAAAAESVKGPAPTKEAVKGKSAPGPAAAIAPAADDAVRLLALLQTEARLIDFVMEDIDGFTDEQVGAGVRSVHSGCRRILRERVAMEPVLRDEEGSTVQVPEGFDPSAIRLVGNVSGRPPFYGTLQHHGWRVVSLNFPAQTGAVDARIVAPAEVEV